MSQDVAIYNMDLMAIISGFLSWLDTMNYILVCKLWQHSYLTRPWGSPAFLTLKQNLPPNEKFIKYIKRFIVNRMQNPQIWDLLRLTKISDLTINNRNIDLTGIEQLKVDKLTIGLMLNWGNPQFQQIERFININTQLKSLDLDSASILVIGFLPELTYLRVSLAQFEITELRNFPNLHHIHIQYYSEPSINIDEFYAKLLHSSVVSIFIDAQYIPLHIITPLIAKLNTIDKSHITHVTILAGVMDQSYMASMANIKTLHVKIFDAFGHKDCIKN